MSHKSDTQTGSQKSRDLRVKRTEMMLQQAFMDLVVEVGFNAITVQMLAERAMINRATFYRHYEDIYGLVEKVYRNLAEEYLDAVRSIKSGHPVEAWQCLFDHCGTYSSFYLALLSELPRFQELIRDMGEQQLAAYFKNLGLDEEAMSTPLPIVLRFWISAQTGLVQWWLESGQVIPSAEMAQHLWRLFEDGPIEQLQLPHRMSATMNSEI